MQIALKNTIYDTSKICTVASLLAMIISFEFFADCRFSNILVYLI